MTSTYVAGATHGVRANSVPHLSLLLPRQIASLHIVWNMMTVLWEVQRDLLLCMMTGSHGRPVLMWGCDT